MERTKFPVKLKGELTKKESLGTILKDLESSEKARILTNDTEVQARLMNIKKDIYYIGKLLTETKRLLPHGKFGNWIRIAFGNDLPYSTARFYMRVFEVFKDNPTTIHYIPTKYLLSFIRTDFPIEIVKMLNENQKDIDKNKLIKINQYYDMFKSGTIGGSQFLQLAKEQIKLGYELMRGNSKHRLNSNIRKTFEFGLGDILTRIDSWKKEAEEMAGLFPTDPDSVEHKEILRKIGLDY